MGNLNRVITICLKEPSARRVNNRQLDPQVLPLLLMVRVLVKVAVS